MKRLLMVWTILTCLLISPAFLAAEVAPPAEGGKLPDIRLAVPTDTGYQTYLGIKGEGTFSFPRSRHPVVIVEIFSMYCPHCQKEAPNVNDLYSKIQSNEKLKDKVKLVGIGVGNSPFEVDIFQKDVFNSVSAVFRRLSLSFTNSSVKSEPLILSASKTIKTALIPSFIPNWEQSPTTPAF